MKATIATAVDKNGEVVPEFEGMAVEITPPGTKKAYSKARDANAPGYMPIEFKHHTKANVDELALIYKDMTPAQIVLLNQLVPYIRYDDNHLAYNNGADIGTEDIVAISKVGRSQCYKLIAELIEMDVLYRGENSRNKQYFINPWLYVKGNRINKVLKTMFKNYRVRTRGDVPWGKMTIHGGVLDGD